MYIYIYLCSLSGGTLRGVSMVINLFGASDDVNIHIVDGQSETEIAKNETCNLESDTAGCSDPFYQGLLIFDDSMIL